MLLKYTLAGVVKFSVLFAATESAIVFPSARHDYAPLAIVRL
jgi:hypothetical protein